MVRKAQPMTVPIKQHITNRLMKKLFTLAAATLVASTTFAQAWPAKQPIKLVAVFPPGGSVDQVARIVSQPLSTALGQTVIVENKGGA